MLYNITNNLCSVFYFVVVSPCIVFVQSMVSRFTLAILFMAIFLYDQCSAQICFHKKNKKKYTLCITVAILLFVYIFTLIILKHIMSCNALYCRKLLH